MILSFNQQPLYAESLSDMTKIENLIGDINSYMWESAKIVQLVVALKNDDNVHRTIHIENLSSSFLAVTTNIMVLSSI